MKQDFASLLSKIESTTPESISQTLQSNNHPPLTLHKKSLLSYLQQSSNPQKLSPYSTLKKQYYKTSTQTPTAVKHNRTYTFSSAYNTNKYASKAELKDSPWLDRKNTGFENRENVYIRIVDIIGLYFRLGKQYKGDFLHYATSTSEFNKLVSLLDMYRQPNSQFQLLIYLLAQNNDSLLLLYHRLRKQILSKCSLDPLKYKPISTHNQHKYFVEDTVMLNKIEIDYVYWGVLVQFAKCQIQEDMLWDITKGNRKIGAVLFVQVCIWAKIREINNK